MPCCIMVITRLFFQIFSFARVNEWTLINGQTLFLSVCHLTTHRARTVQKLISNRGWLKPCLHAPFAIADLSSLQFDWSTQQQKRTKKKIIKYIFIYKYKTSIKMLKRDRADGMDLGRQENIKDAAITMNSVCSAAPFFGRAWRRRRQLLKLNY